MSSRSERYKQRKNVRNAYKETAHIKELSNSAPVGRLLDQEPDTEFVERVLKKDVPIYNLRVSQEEVTESLELLDRQFTKDKYDTLFESSRDVLIDQLLDPLKLSRSDLANVDRDFKYDRDDYTKSPSTVGGDGISFDAQKKQTRDKATTSDGKIRDVNTGLYHDASEMDLDHNKPLKSFHDEGGFMLTDAEKRQFGSDPDNHDFTHRSINRSKGDQDHKDFVDKSGNDDIDKRRSNAAHERGEKAAEKYVPSSKVEKTVFVAKRAAEDGVKVGAAQGLQQALGALISEFIYASYSEVKDILDNGWKNGKYDVSWVDALVTRLNNIKSKLLSKWKNVVEAFATGALSGFFSAIITALINMFDRTGKNIVRLIREGFMSLMKALKTFIFPPEGLTPKQAAHEATKVLATGLVVSGSILAGEAIATMLNGIPFADTISMVLTGMISGLGSLFVVFMIDKLDLLGVNKNERHDFIMGKLESRIELNVEKIEASIQRLNLSYTEKIIQS
ncbi:hypothetical protein CBF23_012255 [Marinomonas agarivorans]|nr:hypothetical protein CBF23_012255 [Marinomonas agarivorans]